MNTNTSDPDPGSPTAVGCLDPGVSADHHLCDLRCDYSNAARHHWPRHCPKCIGAPYWHHSQLGPWLQSRIASGLSFTHATWDPGSLTTEDSWAWHEEALLPGTTLLCSPQQEANLLNPQPMLTDNHIKMMDALCHLDTIGLQFICESLEALRRERTHTQAPPGYRTLQASDVLRGITSQSHSPMSHEFYRAASNLSTTIVEPQQISPQQHPAAIATPSIIHHQSTLERIAAHPYRCPQEERRPKTQGSRPLLIYCVYTICMFVCALFRFSYFCTACVLFRVPCKYFRVVQ